MLPLSFKEQVCRCLSCASRLHLLFLMMFPHPHKTTAGESVVSLQLVYEDLTRSRPTRCVMTSSDPAVPGLAPRLRAEERMFLELPASAAFQAVFLAAPEEDPAASEEQS